MFDDSHLQYLQYSSTSNAKRKKKEEYKKITKNTTSVRIFIVLLVMHLTVILHDVSIVMFV